MSTVQIKMKIFRHVDGWLTDNESIWLYDQAQNAKGDILEIGSYEGKSTLALASGAQRHFHLLHIHAVDPHTLSNNSYKKLLDNLVTYDMLDRVHTYKMTSKEFHDIWNHDRKFNFVFIDGDHRYEACKMDWDLWYPLVEANGVIALHDAQGSANGASFDLNHNPFPGVSRVADEHIKNKANEWGMVDRICWMRKPE